MRVKLQILFFVSVCMLFSEVVLAKPHPFGLGVVIGSPTGFTGKYKLNRRNAIDGTLAWSLGGSSKVHIHSDYLWLKPRMIKLEKIAIDVFFGVGGRINTYEKDGENETRIGVRVPGGVSYTFQDPRIETFAEVAFIMNFISSTNLDLDAGIGARYYF